MKTYAIATIPGDGIGKEVIPAGQQVLQVLAATSGNFDFSFEHFAWGGDARCARRCNGNGSCGASRPSE